MSAVHEPEPIEVVYTNYREEKMQRTIVPRRVYWGANEWHLEPQWLLDCFDLEKDEERTYALKDCDFPSATW